MLNNAIGLGNDVVSECSKKGMEAIEIYFSYSNLKQVIMNGKSISSQRATEELGAGIRVLHQSSEGFSFTNILTKEALLKCAEEAQAVAKLSPKIEGVGLAEKDKITPIEGAYSKEIASLTAEDITKHAIDFLEGLANVDSRLNTALSSVTINVNGTAITNSLGVEAQRKSSNFQGGFAVVARDKDKSGAFTFDSLFTRKDDADLRQTSEELGKRAIDSLNQQTITAFEGPVIFQENAVFNPIFVVAGQATSADLRQRGISAWKDKLADKVASESFNLLDRPYDLSGGGGVKSFDAEGNPTQDLEIIKDGILQTFMHSQRTANKEKLKSTGNAARFGSGPSFSNPPTQIFPNSPWVSPGDMTKEEMISDVKKGLIVHNFQGTVRGQSGVFSGVAKGAYLIESGEITVPVTGVSLSGNVFDILNKITGVGKELELANGFLKAPIIRFEGIRIST